MRMAWSIDHVAVSAFDLERTASFYEDVFGMVKTQLKMPDHPETPIKKDQFAHLLDQVGSSLHLINPTPNFFVKFPNLDQNPTGPHVAITVQDLDAIKQQLEAIPWLYSAPREWGPTGYSRVYTDDPYVTTFEPNQRVNDTIETGRDVKVAVPQDDGRAKWWLDHACAPALDVRASAKWLTGAIGLREQTPPAEAHLSSDKFASFPEEDSARLGIQFAHPDVENGHGGAINRYEKGHFGILVEDLDVIRHALEKIKVPFEEGTELAAPGREVIFARDPSRNVVEVGQRD
jgi:catechol 2,3-dioxygenase-like lactoylglutathione lyase family enzyme